MLRFSTISVLILISVGCSDASTSREADSSVQATVIDQDLPTVLVYKSPTCGCCNGWIDHLRAAGFTVDARNTTDIMPVKLESGVPVQMSSCHTAIIDGYVVEGHVPADQVKRLLAERPDLAGIAVPGMPTGSPGMEGPNARPYEVLSFTHSGEAAVYAVVDPS